MTKLKALIFDVDGVIIYSEKANVAFFQAILQKGGYKKPSQKEVLDCYHLTLRGTLEVLINSKDEAKVDKLWQLAHDRSLYPLNLLEFPPEIEKILESFHLSYRLGIVSGRIKEGVQDVFKLKKISHLFDVIVTSDEYKNPKPHPEPLLIALERFGIESSETVYIGDSHTDIDAAKAAGMNSIHLSPTKHGDATIGITDFSELPDAVAKLAEKLT